MKKLNITNVTNVHGNQHVRGEQELLHGRELPHEVRDQDRLRVYCYPGKHHSHWHHCIWDPCFKSHYFFCPCASCYYYWCATDYCYYPCHWFVDYGNCYYPWWICGGFGGYGYVATPHLRSSSAGESG